MNRIVVEGPIGIQLGGLDSPVEVVDEAGHTLGHFVPVTDRASAECPYSPEDLERMRLERGGRALADVWKSLGAK